MKIDYSTPNYSKYLLYADIGVQQSIRHIKLSIIGNELGMTRIEQISHLVLALLKLIPILGHLTAWIDKKINATYIKKLTIESTNPYQQGLQHGTAFKKEIQELYRLILKLKDSTHLRRVSKSYEKNIPKDLVDEMRGLAKGADVSYEDVLFIHTFLDGQPGNFGCSAMARKFGSASPEKRIAAANHTIAKDTDCVSNRRRNLLNSSAKTAQEILQSSNVNQTLQSIVFDSCSKSMDLSSSEGNAAFKSMQTFTSEELFGMKTTLQHPVRMQLLRNLDWPWYFLGQSTLVLTRPIEGKKVSSVTFPGYIGSLSGMNEDGLCLAACSQGSVTNTQGLPNTLLFTKILAKCSSVAEAVLHLHSTRHGSSMNLIIADPTNAESVELTGDKINTVGTIRDTSSARMEQRAAG